MKYYKNIKLYKNFTIDKLYSILEETPGYTTLNNDLGKPTIFGKILLSINFVSVDVDKPIGSASLVAPAPLANSNSMNAKSGSMNSGSSLLMRMTNSNSNLMKIVDSNNSKKTTEEMPRKTTEERIKERRADIKARLDYHATLASNSSNYHTPNLCGDADNRGHLPLLLNNKMFLPPPPGMHNDDPYFGWNSGRIYMQLKGCLKSRQDARSHFEQSAEKSGQPDQTGLTHRHEIALISNLIGSIDIDQDYQPKDFFVWDNGRYELIDLTTKSLD